MIRAILRNSGFRPAKLWASVQAWGRYSKDRKKFRAMVGNDVVWGNDLPMLNEHSESSGAWSSYLLQDLLVARWVFQDRPQRHVDVGSRVDGFVAQVASFRQIEVIDIRPALGPLAGVDFHQLDIMESLPETWRSATDSLSCLHTIEHFGLGRYGDTLDQHGHKKGAATLRDIVAPGGRLYLSTPMGNERVEFNAHRIFKLQTILDFVDGWHLERFSYIDDEGKLHHEPDFSEATINSSFGCKTGLAILCARRPNDL